VTSLDQSAEVGPRYLARLPSYQVDRSALDEEVLRRAVESGASRSGQRLSRTCNFIPAADKRSM